MSASVTRQPGPRLFLDGSENRATAAQGETAYHLLPTLVVVP